MAANPIYIESEEEIPEVIERIRATSGSDVPLVLPARSRLGQSRFNFQLLKQYANQLGKRVAIITADPAVQLMAEESGFSAYKAIDQYGVVPAGTVAPTEGTTAVAAGAVAAGTPARAGAATPARISIVNTRQLSKAATEIRPGRALLYFGSLAVLIVGIVGLAVYVPSAQVTLVATATPFSIENLQVDAAPGTPPVKVRTVAESKQASSTFKATGSNTIPATVASGNVVFTNKCPFGLMIKRGQRVHAVSNGFTFAVNSDVDLASAPTATAPIIGAAPGAGGNVGAGDITAIDNSSGFSCLSVNNPAATGGGADEKKQVVIQQSDYEAARSALQQQLQSQITDDLGKQVAAGEKLSDAIQFDAPDLAIDHKVGEVVGGFNGTMTLKAEGAFYSPDDVSKAFTAALKKKLSPGQELIPNKNVATYTVTGSAGGHLTFRGSANGFTAPKLDAERVKSRLAARTLGQAKADLAKLPGINSAQIKESPLRLPIMPLVSSRISLTYDIRQGPAAPPKTG